jgi:cysteinyl-tRNA synthetase
MAHSILDTIGQTPLVEITRLNPNSQVKIFAKLEYFNPGGSIKDRAALYMIEAGEKSGQLTPGKTVIEATSGNTGIGLALICAVKGYRLLLTMSDAVSIERRKILKARGADILLTPGHLGTDGAIEEVYRLARENPDRYFMADQYNTEANWKAHYHGTAEEIWQQTDGRVTMFVATMGTTGTLMGVSRRLKELNAKVEIVGVEPYLGHKLQGLKNMKEAYCPEIFNKKLLDRKVNIEDEKAFEMARRLAKEEGLFVGMSSGAAMAAALEEAKVREQGTIVTIFPDSGERYLSTTLFAEKEKVDLRVFNGLNHSKEPLHTNIPNKVRLYTCGPTAHDRIHLSECRRFVFADMLRQYLVFRGYEVEQVVNITDLDDKTIQGSEEAGSELKAFTEKHIQSFFDDLKLMGVKAADQYPLASEHLDDMVALSEKLVRRGFAYEKLRSLYFNLSKFNEYGRLSGIDVNKIKLGATVDLDEYEKNNPRDFTLFKRSKLSELKRGLYVKTGWGNVRPSWQIQCVAMSMKYLGDFFDIHTSSRDLAFPHHENEIAIATAATGKPLAKFWMHCERVLSEDRNTRLTLKDLTESAMKKVSSPGRVIRFWLLASHYRKPLAFSQKQLDAAQKALQRLDACIYSLQNISDGKSYPEINQLIYDIKQGFTNAMDDDLNISAALSSLFKNIKRINKLVMLKNIDPQNACQIVNVFKELDSVLNFFNFDQHASHKDMAELMERREKARQDKNWGLADSLRQQLVDLGVPVRDKKI